MTLHSKKMIEKQDAISLYGQALKAIEALSITLDNATGKCSQEDYARIKRAIGTSIGQIQVDILDLICQYHPELDHLK